MHLRPTIVLAGTAAFVVGLLLGALSAQAATGPSLALDLGSDTDRWGTGIQLVVLFTLLSFAPAMLIGLSAFVRIVIVLSFVRQAVGTQQMPPNQVILALALFLTFFVMMPTFREINQEAIEPYLEETLPPTEAMQRGFAPLRAFMLRQTREKDLALFVDVAKMNRPQNRDEIPTSVLIPSFIISEVKTAFEIGLLLYVPFLIIDMVVAAVLLSMGMMMLPPVMVSLPFKLLLFVLADGWYLLVGSLVKSFG
jgi:flagellar biosynthetic protein FliP